MANKAKKIFPISDRDIEEVRAIFGKTAEDVNEDVEELLCWMEEQPHLPKNPDRERIERFLLRNKFRVDQTKEKLEAYYTMRVQYSDFLKNLDPGCEAMANLHKSVLWAPMPVLTPDKERVMIVKYLEKTADLFHFQTYMIHMFNLIDVQLSHDYAVGERVVIDMSEFGFKHLKAVGLRTMYYAIRIYQNAFSGRLTGMELINPPSFLPIVMSIIELASPKKFFEKIKVHKDISTLYERVPKMCLPSEYGGDLDVSVSYINDRKQEMLLAMRDTILEHHRQVADESLRMK